MPDIALKNTKFKVPNKCQDYIKNAYKTYSNLPDTTEGYVRARNIIDNPIISLSLLKKIVNYFSDARDNTPTYHLTGGDVGKELFPQLLQHARTGLEGTRRNKKRGEMMNTYKKEGGTKDMNSNPTKVASPKGSMTVKELTEETKRFKNIINYK
tara:strand:- start:3678 stop:4139 length:462 start_codon:yes stop_codon:yes gene_type:complete